MRFRCAALLLGLLLASSAVGSAASDCLAPTRSALARTDQQTSGNRTVEGCGPLAGTVLDVELRGTPAWVLPDPRDHGGSWFVVLEDGTVERVLDDGRGTALVSPSETPQLEPGAPPMALATGEDDLVFGSALGATGWFVDPLPDTRVTETADHALVALVGATDRYDHGVLGDDLEAAAAEVRDDRGNVTRIAVGPDEVIEGTSAMVLELVDQNAGPELLVTVSDAVVGARLRAYGLDGAAVAESTPIGQGYRWLHQVGAGRLASDGELEIVAVRTPHIGGTVEAYRLDDGRLERVASIGGYSSHRLGSANLDMALLADVAGDGRLEVVVPTQDMSALGVLARTVDGFEELARLELGGTLATNVAATAAADGSLVMAAGTAGGGLRIFR